jgi:hypothetical protein
VVGLPGLEPGTFGPPDRRANQAAPQPVRGESLRSATRGVRVRAGAAAGSDGPVHGGPRVGVDFGAVGSVHAEVLMVEPEVPVAVLVEEPVMSTAHMDTVAE